MKKTKIIIPAIGMLLLSTAASITGTVAWFSMNTTVTATGMSIKATSSNVFLQIIPGTSSDNFDSTLPQTIAEANVASKDVFPTTVGSAVSASAVTDLVGTEELTDLAWASAHSNSPDTAIRDGDFTDVSSSANSPVALNNKYTLINQFLVRLNPTSGVSTAADLIVDSVTISAAVPAKATLLTAVRLLVLSDDGVAVFNSAGNVVEGKTTKIIAESITTTPSTVSTYIFFEGEDSSVTTNNIINSDGYNVSFTMSVTA